IVRGHELLRYATDRTDVARFVDGAGAGDDPTAGQILRIELVDYAQSEHETGARAADPVQLDAQLERHVELRRDLHPDPAGVIVTDRLGGHRHAARLPVPQ